MQLFSEALGDSNLPTIIMVHGFPFDSGLWNAQWDILSPSARLVRFDVRGFGKSDGADTHWTIDHIVDDVLAIADSREIEQFILLGLSMGGYVALRACERAAPRIRGLILADTKAAADTNEEKIRRSSVIRKLRTDGVQDDFVQSFLDGALSESTLANNALHTILGAMIHSQSSQAIQAALLAMAARSDTSHVLETISVPTLVIGGEQDRITPLHGMKTMAARIPGASFVSIPNAGHVSNMENPAKFNAAIRSFLGSF